jgi:hypothetical protein
VDDSVATQKGALIVVRDHYDLWLLVHRELRPPRRFGLTDR